jgi:hypothetical protein
MSSELIKDQNLACDECGKFGAYKLDGQNLCDECYVLKGSCCAPEHDQP